MTEGTHTWRVKYYKGLGTSTSAEAKQYFSDMDRHCIQFKYIGREDDDAIELVRPHAYTHTYVRTYVHTHTAHAIFAFIMTLHMPCFVCLWLLHVVLVCCD